MVRCRGLRVPEGSEVTQERHVTAGSSSKANQARLPPSSSSEFAPSGIAIVAPTSIDVGIAIVILISSDAGISHELEAALAAIVAPSSSDVGIAIVAIAIAAIAIGAPLSSDAGISRELEAAGVGTRNPGPARRELEGALAADRMAR